MRHVSITLPYCLSFEHLPWTAISTIQGMPPWHKRPRWAIRATETSVALYDAQYLICYLYRCELERASVIFFGELEDGKLCSCCAESSGKFRARKPRGQTELVPSARSRQGQGRQGGGKFGHGRVSNRHFRVYLGLQRNSLAANLRYLTCLSLEACTSLRGLEQTW